MATKKQDYGNDSISSLKGADRVRKRPGVIFGSDGLDGCEHAVFEILSNSIDEAREGHGRVITVTRYNDRSIQVEDMGRGCPVDWNEKEQRYNWELVYCELYAGGKYDNLTGDNYEYSFHCCSPVFPWEGFPKGKAPKRRRGRIKRGAFEEMARLAAHQGRESYRRDGVRWRPPCFGWGSKGEGALRQRLLPLAP